MIDLPTISRYAEVRQRKVLATVVILGEPASKANSRQLVMIHGRMVPIKSAKARTYAQTCAWQCPILSPLPEEELFIAGTIWYRTEKPDLDPSVILDSLQGRLYVNDRQVREQHWYHAIDRGNPRIEFVLGLRHQATQGGSDAGDQRHVPRKAKRSNRSGRLDP